MRLPGTEKNGSPTQSDRLCAVECSEPEWSPSEQESEGPLHVLWRAKPRLPCPPHPKYQRPALQHSCRRGCGGEGRSAGLAASPRGTLAGRGPIYGTDEDWPRVPVAISPKEPEEAWRLEAPNPGVAGSGPRQP